MDKSKQYIKMCDCDEIQGRWELKEGDMVYWPSDPSNIELFADEDVDAWTIDEIKKEHGGGVWLPRQDQLQDIINDDDYTPEDFLNIISVYCMHNNCDKYGGEIAGSMEQLWLSTFMHKKFNKKWNGNKWE